ncbi:Aerobic-type carbon monoxide dehydrogenase, middle subunit CoxM/CutM-like protein [Desulfosarcina cetonica]|uniref:FAD binding domain-containing protein n=1 Tax=Desulfosarcina cetonica TaxID=90730 RepID=UPI0006D28451|nr:FAD binding domain-containing protein [Desulfosarcina cetonica]VTR67291.1 Aerobic-type carbon monoxide dehydrogenase, middle subunit CoxM/CutM-like protein [Desulfosarcina cetonica]
MQPFQHQAATSVADTIAILSTHKGRAKLMAGGTDLLGILKTRATVAYPKVVVNIKSIAGLDKIQSDGQGLSLGALTRLADIVDSEVIRDAYPILAEAAASVAMPQIRNVGTIGGNLAQETRCWYFRYPHSIGGRIMCKRKGEAACLAVKGDNRYHAIFGGKKCFAVCPSDMAVALAALDAEIQISGAKGQRSVAVTGFYHPLGNVLETDEMITGIKVPRPAPNNRQVFIKHRVRDAIDFATVSVGLVVSMDAKTVADVRVVLGAVASGPYRATDAEAALVGRKLDPAVIEKAAEASVAGAVPLSGNAYKVDITKTLVRQALQI